MRPAKSTMMACIALVMVGCGWKQAPVPVIANGGAVTALVGEWFGEYESRDTGRSGTITFRLRSASDSAYGDVLMVPRVHVVQAPQQNPSDRMISPANVSAEPLQIRFVELEGSRVFGTLAPYKDPACGCTLTTTFEGRFTNENTIEGTYSSRGSEVTHETTRGEWKVTRRKIVSRTKRGGLLHAARPFGD